MNEIKPCPFCGSEAIRVVDTITNLYVPVSYVICCDCNGRSASKRDKQKAIDAWNRRAEIPEN